MAINDIDLFSDSQISLKKIGGVVSTNGAEIAAFDSGSDRLFVVAGSVVETQKIDDKGTITADGSLALGFTPPAGTNAIPNSVAVKNGIVAVAYAIQNTTTNAQEAGQVSFYRAATGAFLNSVTVGALPDMLTFTPDGTRVLVANEGEPNSYGQANSVDPEGSVSIINIAGGVGAATVQTASFSGFNSQINALKAAGVRITAPGATVARDLEPEYIAVSPDGLTARVTLQENNAIAVLDIASATITSIAPLGVKDHSLPGNALDASDRDLTASTGTINIRNQPVFGLYQPDAIASFSINGQAYYITANEGDARDYTGFAEESRVGATGYVLDPVKFPNAATLKQNGNLGRLTVTNATGDTDRDGDIDRIEAFGARSFSIWDASGKQIFDSGDQLEKITATQAPTLFNSDGAAASFDARSDNKGPEPEGVAIGVINNRTYAFIGLERVGDVIVYDVTNPTKPQFVQYLNTPEDVGTEGLSFISASDSPTGKPLLVTANEVSKTVALFEIAIEPGKSVTNSSFLGQQTFVTGLVPAGDAGKLNGVDVPLGGLSGVTYDAANNRYYAISDDRSQFGAARFYTFNLDPATLTTTGVSFTGVTALKDTSGNTFALNSLDPEGIALSGNGTIFVSSEGEARPDLGASRVTNPFIKEFSLTTGQEIRSFTVPDKFLPKIQDTNGDGVVNTGDTQTAGIRNNLAFESLTITPDQQTLFTATENALFQDGAVAATTVGSRSRILQYNVATGLPEKEFIYVTDAVAAAPVPANGFNTNGLVDLLAIDNKGTILALERSFSAGVPGTGNTIKIYELSLQGASDISAIDSLAGLTPEQLNALKPAQKRLVLNLDDLKLPTGLDNVEGLAFGPKLADGRQSIVLVSDNNFSATQFTQILTLSADLTTVVDTPLEVQPKITNYDFTNLPKLGTASNGQEISLGGFSGLYFQGLAANGNLKFVTHTDRGPNGEPTGANRPFLLPNFQPEIVNFELNRATGKIDITKRTGLFRADGTTPLTGLPNLQAQANGLAYTDEVGVDLAGKVLPNDPFGADVEGIVVAPNGDYWLVDEYRPAIYRFDANGKMLDRFIPKGTAAATEPDSKLGSFGTEVLPEVYAQRRSNRGFEAVALDGNKLYAFIQSPIDNPDNAGDSASRASRNLRILEFDTVSKTVTGEYVYLLDSILATGNAKTDKLGDAVALGNGKFALVERDDLATNASNKLIYQIDLAGATNINNPANFTLPTGKTIEQLTAAELATAKITPVSKSLIANAAQLGYTGVEKLEGLALVAPNTLALINDNDFNVAGGNVPSRLGLLELAKDLPVTTDLELTQTLDNNNPNLGDRVTFTLTVANKGVVLANGIKVTDLLPTELSFISATPSQGAYDSTTGVWDVGEIAANGIGTLQITAKVNANASVVNRAEITAQKQPDRDSTAGNNLATEDDQAATTLSVTALISTTANSDTLIAGVTPGFDGSRDIVFTGAGNDTVDITIAGISAGKNRIDLGRGNDIVYIADADRAFGRAGDDEFEATDAKDYRASGGAGNDIFYLGTNGRALGGDGNDKFFVGTGGDNIISGGAGVDQFWIANGEAPKTANTILDFQVGTDVIGIQGIGANATNIVLTQVGENTSIGFGGETLALLQGIQANSLTPNNGGQFVFV
jgi:uncharacterized repeat protein (TIGR01451 family)